MRSVQEKLEAGSCIYWLFLFPYWSLICLTVDAETSVASGEYFLHHGEADELFLKQERENLSGKEFLDEVIVENVRFYGNVYLDLRFPQ